MDEERLEPLHRYAAPLDRLEPRIEAEDVDLAAQSGRYAPTGSYCQLDPVGCTVSEAVSPGGGAQSHGGGKIRHQCECRLHR